jgi:hypothetical protein
MGLKHKTSRRQFLASGGVAWPRFFLTEVTDYRTLARRGVNDAQLDRVESKVF